MKPPLFDYHDPRSLEEALELLQRHRDEAKVLAGGQSLMPLLNFRVSAPTVLIDINRVSDLSYIRSHAGQLRIGALTRQRTIEFSPLVQKHLPLLHQATTLIGHLPIRTRGTIGGSMVHADPAAEYPAVAVALEAEFVVRGPSGTRIVSADDFFVTYLTTAVMPDELLVEIRFPITDSSGNPISGATSRCAFTEFSRRNGDFALVGVAALIDAEGEKGEQCRSVRLATAGVGPTPIRLREVERLLEHNGLAQTSLIAAGCRAAELVEPDSDLHASGDFRRHLTQVLTQRAIRHAITSTKEPTV